LRRLIRLIFAGWLPPVLGSSRSYLGLSSRVSPKAPHSVVEDSPNQSLLPHSRFYMSNTLLVREAFTVFYATFVAMLPGCFSSQAMAQMKPNNSRAMAVQALFFGIPRAAK